MSGKNAAFAVYGAVPRNAVWSWSARSPDGKTVALTLWKDEFDYKSRPVRYSTFGKSGRPEWADRNGNLERIENLRWARDFCDGLFRVVIVEAVDPKVSPRSIKRAYPQENLTMKLDGFDEETGEFSSYIVEK
jgi:hypothetical protein